MHGRLERKPGTCGWFKEYAAQHLALETVVDSLPPGNVEHTFGPVENVNNFLNREVVDRDHMSHDIPSVKMPLGG